MSMEGMNGNDGNGGAAAGAGEHLVGELAGTPLDADRLSQAVELTGPTAVRAYEPPVDPHIEFVMEQYDGMEHMGG
jgi:hypothetical protein